ncbi:hypothetical protein ACHQM5_001938 [Ranunculus cassubicifolius]
MDIGEREAVKKNNNHNRRHSSGEQADNNSTPDFILQWGNRKRLRCMKLQAKNDSTTATTDRTRARINRGVVKPTHKDSTTNKDSSSRRAFSPPPTQAHHRISRNSESMKGQSNNIKSPEREATAVAAESKKGNMNGGASGSSDSKKGGSSSGSDPTIPVWLPKFAIALTNKEKEEDFMAIKGSKLPQRPKKRAKFIQRTLNLVSPGAWLCDLTLERYEVREKKISKKRPRGLKAMGNMMDSDSE